MGRMNKPLDPNVIPLVEYFNENGLTTWMSCEGHNRLYQSMFWISFAHTVTDEDIRSFQRLRTNKNGGFCSCGRFSKRMITGPCGEIFRWEYSAASIEAANEDLRNWRSNEKDCDWCIGGAADLVYGEDKSISCEIDKDTGEMIVYIRGEKSASRIVKYCPMCGRRIGVLKSLNVEELV